MIDAAARSTSTAEGELAVQHEVIVHPGELQAVFIAAAANVVNAQMAKDDVPGGVGVGIIPTIVGVDTVVSGVAHFQVMDDDVVGAHQVNTFTAAFDNWSGFTRGAADPDWRRVSTSQVLEVRPACIRPGVQADRRAGGGILCGALDAGVGVACAAVAGVIVSTHGDVDFERRLLAGLEGGHDWGFGQLFGAGCRPDGQ